MSNNLFCLS